jgi:hypothetical protein
MIDAEATNQLKALGFKIEGNEMAFIHGDMIVSVVCVPEQPNLFGLSITTPKGITFRALTRRTDLFDAYRLRCGARG